MGLTTLVKQSGMDCRGYTLNYNEKTLIMGILNITPDSFSDGGKYNSLDQAIVRARALVEDGADIIDIGGESTRPGAEFVPEEVEMERVIPVIERLAKEVDAPISVDTYKAAVAREALKAGAHIVNDIWGAKAEPAIAAAAAEFDAPIILMHNRKERNYEKLIPDMITDLMESVAIAELAGVENNKIILDPGIGFAKTFGDNMEVMGSLEAFTSLGYPVLLGTSRKTFIGKILDLPPEERMEGTGATVCLGIQKGCGIVRVHDVKEIARMAKMMDAMMGKGCHAHG
ncbi:dihydropteroate synthase [Bacillus sp. SJS]|uniref:dihydropteroate synthase n=1 Tax=Bacillus sp. SJS TaxID=1423321 RepID=UPI0004DD1D4A|nr:dihydropteroate synthase [Bacillus sp. SJS]KZZ86551.1 dihydropteroate synthase [Bacillus sp. SJS]